MTFGKEESVNLKERAKNHDFGKKESVISKEREKNHDFRKSGVSYFEGKREKP